MDPHKIESRTKVIGQRIFEGSRRAKTSVLESSFWQTKMMELSTKDRRVKTQLFRFVDVLPVLKDQLQKRKHLLEYLSKQESAARWPWSLRVISGLLRVPGLDELLVNLSDQQVKQMGKTFIVGDRPEEALPKVIDARDQRIGFTIDILGEAALSHKEADEYYKLYHALIEKLGEESKGWEIVSPIDDSPLGSIPKVNVSIKLSSIDCHLDPMAFEASVVRVVERLGPLMQIAIRKNVFVNFDMESFDLKEITREAFKRLLMMPEFREYRHFGIVNQAYLRCAAEDARDWVEFARKRGTSFSIRLVKGAYWDYETILASQNDWDPPVWTQKYESDLCFEECVRIFLDAFPEIELAVGSHNLRSIAYAMAYAEALGLPHTAIEIQMLYGMANPFKKALVDLGMRLREYAPMGEMLPGLSYLVRRLLENTSNDSFLKQSFMDRRAIEALLEKPRPSERNVS